MNMRAEYGPLLARDKVNVRNAAELELWTELLDVYVSDVVMAVGEVGTSPHKVLDYLLSHNTAGNRSRTPEPSPRRPADGE